MKRTLTPQRKSLASTLFIAVFALLIAVPAQAQNDGGRMRILVGNFEGEGNNGEGIANRVRSQLDRLPTHVSVQRNEYRDAIRQAGLSEDAMNCLLNRQLALRMGVPLVICGTFQRVSGGLVVDAEVIAAETGESFTIQEFQVRNNNEAGDRVVQEFSTYVEFLGAVDNCNTYLGIENYDGALENCNRALEINPGTESVEMLRARVHYEMEDFQTAYDQYRSILDRNPINQDAMLLAGLSVMKLGQPETGMDYLRRYLELNPDNVDVRLTVATDVNSAGNPAGALEIAEAGIGLDSVPNQTLVLYAGHYAMNAAQQIQSNAANGEATAARPYFEKALHYYGQVFDALGNEADPLMLRRMIQALTLLERNDEAADLGARALEVAPEDADLWAAYADALQRAGRVEDALAALDKVRELDPDAQRIAFRRAVLLLQSDQLDRAVSEFRAAIQNGETTADDVSNAIFAHGYNQKYRDREAPQNRESIPYLQAALDFAESPEVRGAPAFFLGFMEYQRGNGLAEGQSLQAAQQALPAFQEALRLLELSRPWVATQPPSMGGSLQQVVSAVQQLIEIQELIIQRGR